MGHFFKRSPAKKPTRINTPSPENVPGDWFVAADCCTLCNVPSTVAPDLFEFKIGQKGEEYCFVRKQPINDAETAQMIEAATCAELECIRYVGQDPNILGTLKNLGAESILADNDLSRRA